MSKRKVPEILKEGVYVVLVTCGIICAVAGLITEEMKRKKYLALKGKEM